jgi:hypothetical protein
MGKILRYQVQWSVQFFVAAEWSCRDYLISLALGHASATDFSSGAPKGQVFAVDAKVRMAEAHCR